MMMLAQQTDSFLNNVVYPLSGWILLLVILAPFFIFMRRTVRRQRVHLDMMAEHTKRVEQQLERIAQAVERTAKGGE